MGSTNINDFLGPGMRKGASDITEIVHGVLRGDESMQKESEEFWSGFFEEMEKSAGLGSAIAKGTKKVWGSRAAKVMTGRAPTRAKEQATKITNLEKELAKSQASRRTTAASYKGLKERSKANAASAAAKADIEKKKAMLAAGGAGAAGGVILGQSGNSNKPTVVKY
jgi:hypothetical protein